MIKIKVTEDFYTDFTTIYGMFESLYPPIEVVETPVFDENGYGDLKLTSRYLPIDLEQYYILNIENREYGGKRFSIWDIEVEKE